MNKARMTFRFGEESQKTAHQLSNHIVEKKETPRTNPKIALETDITPISLDPGSVPPLETHHPLDEGNDRTGYRGEQHHLRYHSEEQKQDKEDTYYGNPIYDDWGEPFGPYVGSSMIEKSTLTESSSVRENNRDPYDDLPMPHYPEVTAKSYAVHHRKSPGGWKVFGSVTAAIMTGVLFGFVAMSMLDSGTDTTSQTVKGPAGTEVVSSAENTQTQSLGTDTLNLASTAVSIPAATYFMLQYGVFSTPEGASQAKHELTKAGIAAGSDPLDESRVYAGVSSNREEAKLVSNQLKTEGVELYVREISLPAVSDVVFIGNADEVSPFFENSRILTDMLASLSITHIGEQVQTAVPKDKLSEISDLHHRFTSSVGAIHAGVSENGKQIERKMESSMSTAISALSEYNKNPNKEHMWKVQSAVMDYILQEKQLLEVMKQT